MGATTPDQIRQWVEQARREGARWLLIAHDSFDGEDYPVSISVLESPWQQHDRLVGAGERIHEAYDLGVDDEALEAQLQASRAWSMPARGA